MEQNNNITLFDYKNIKVRTVIIDGDVWFIVKDVCDNSFLNFWLIF